MQATLVDTAVVAADTALAAADTVVATVDTTVAMADTATATADAAAAPADTADTAVLAAAVSAGTAVVPGVSLVHTTVMKTDTVAVVAGISVHTAATAVVAPANIAAHRCPSLSSPLLLGTLHFHADWHATRKAVSASGLTVRLCSTTTFLNWGNSPPIAFVLSLATAGPAAIALLCMTS